MIKFVYWKHFKMFFMLVLVTSWKSNSGPSKPPTNSESEHGHTWLHGKFPNEVQYSILIL